MPHQLPMRLQVLAGMMVLALAACSPLPDTGVSMESSASVSKAETRLLPLDEILAQADALARDGADTGSLEARLAALRARAALLRRM